MTNAMKRVTKIFIVLLVGAFCFAGFGQIAYADPEPAQPQFAGDNFDIEVGSAPLTAEDVITKAAAKATDATGAEIPTNQLTVNTADLNALNSALASGQLGDYNVKLEAPTGQSVTIHVSIIKASSAEKTHVAYIVGFVDGTVRPNASITRAEVCAIVYRIMDDNARSKYFTKNNNFSDVSSNDWFNNAVSTVAAAGVVVGYPDGTFKGDASITRAEIAAIFDHVDSSIITDIIKVENAANEKNFKDVAENHWASAYIKNCSTYGWLVGYIDGSFRPDNPITRAETMTIINSALGRNKIERMLPTMIQWKDNMNTAEWYYKAVQEATNSHKYTRNSSNAEVWTSLLATPDWKALEAQWIN